MFVFQVEDSCAIGAGEDYARGALYMGATPEEAVKAACSLCVMTAEPIVTASIVIDTKKNDEINNKHNDN